MKTRKAAWFEIYVDDMEKATKFYETVFNTKLEPLGDPSDQNTIKMSFPGDIWCSGVGIGFYVPMKRPHGVGILLAGDSCEAAPEIASTPCGNH